MSGMMAGTGDPDDTVESDTTSYQTTKPQSGGTVTIGPGDLNLSDSPVRDLSDCQEHSVEYANGRMRIWGEWPSPTTTVDCEIGLSIILAEPWTP